MEIVRTNPPRTKDLPLATTLALFPNISTLHVKDSAIFETIGILPPTITAVIVDCWKNAVNDRTRAVANIVTVINDVFINDSCFDLTPFSSPRRLQLSSVPKTLIFPLHRLQRVRVVPDSYRGNELDVLVGEWYERLDVIAKSVEDFKALRAVHRPPNVHVFCANVGEGVSPAEFLQTSPNGSFEPSKTFGVAELRAFDAVHGLLFKQLGLNGSCLDEQDCDISFLTTLTYVCTYDMAGKTLALPTTVESLKVFHNSARMSVTGTENVTSLELWCPPLASASFPALKKLFLRCGDCPNETVGLPLGTLTRLTLLRLVPRTLADDFVFPPDLSNLMLHIETEAFNIAPVARLPHLGYLHLNWQQRKDPLDLSPFTSLTNLSVLHGSVAKLPKGLRVCAIPLDGDFDFSAMTSLTRLHIVNHTASRVTFPTQLRELHVGCQMFGESNVKDVALEAFSFHGVDLGSREMLERLPKTISRCTGFFEHGVKDQLPEIFPLYTAPTYDESSSAEDDEK